MRSSLPNRAGESEVKAGPAARWRALQPLTVRNFRFYWLATLPWNLARWMEIVVAGWLMLELTNSPWQVALLGFTRSAALPFFGLVAGVIADRCDRLTLVRLVQMLNVAVPLGLAWLVAAGLIVPWHLFAGSLLLGLGWALDWPARRALMADIVRSDDLVQATVLENLSMNAMKIVGPALGGWLLYVAGPAPGFAALSVIFGVGIALLLGLRRPPVAVARVTGSTLRNVAAGVAYVVKDRPIRGVLLITIIMNCLVFPYMQLLPVFARDVHRVGPIELGFLAAANGIGALVSLPLIGQMRASGPRGWVYIVGSAGLAGAVLAFAVAPWYGLALALLILGGLGHAGFGTMQSAIILAQASPDMRGRALGALTLSIGASPFGALLMGALAEGRGAPFAVGVCAGVGFVTVIWVAAAVPALRRTGRLRPAT